MSIKALPAETTWLLDASSLIASPVNLVKELVDNAIDAHAASIEVLLAPNTVDKIEVRDDGHGILRADFAALGRPGHTSKLVSLDDLHTRTAEAASLGFRGQGLAAATTLGHVAITTRTRDETVAAAFRLVPGGGGGIVSDSLKPAAASAGTSVTVTCLFSSLPVRRRTAVQGASKAIAAIKTLLCGYALARPQLRLAFHVFQQQQPLVWQYHCRSLVSLTPSTAGSDAGTEMRESARVLFGNDVARQCQDVVVSAAELLPAPGHGNQSTLEHALIYASQGHDRLRELVFEAFLPRPGADLSKLAVGSSVSVDGRPLSVHHRGGMAGKLLAVFRKHLSDSIGPLPLPQRHVREAFLRLNIHCPAGSYDPNVEPAKTDVLFANEKLVCDAFEKLCIRVYGAAEQDSPMRPVNIQPPITGRSFRPVASPHSPTPAGRSLRSVATEPAQAEQRILLDRASRHRGVQRRGLAAQRQRLSHARPVGNTRALQTPPPSSPLEGHRGVRVQGARRRAESPGHADLPGLVSNDGYRQTTIIFGRPPSRAPPGRGAATSGSCMNPQTFMTGREIQRNSGMREIQEREEMAPAKTAMVRNPVGERVDARNAKTDAGLRARGNNGVEKSSADGLRGTASRKAVYVLEADLAKLERAYTRFVSDGVRRGEELGHLSADSNDLSAVKQRLKQAITKWLTQRRANGKGSGPVEIEMYVKRGLKGKTKMTRRLSHGMGRVSHAS